MLSVSRGVKIFLYVPSADLRRGYDGLAARDNRRSCVLAGRFRRLFPAA